MSPAVIAAVLVAGAFGAVIRWAVTKIFASRSDFPRAVLVVNVVGSALAGIIFGLPDLRYDLYLVLVTGFCGGLTTFSTFSVDTVQLLLAGRTRTAVTSVLTNVVVGIAVAALFYAVVSAILPSQIRML